MTCIVAISNPITKEIIIGGDRAISDVLNGITITAKNPKVFQWGSYLFGYAGDIRAGKIVQYSFEPSEPSPHMELDHFMNTEFISALKTCLAENEYEVSKEEHNAGFGLIVAVNGRIFEITSQFEAIEYSTNYIAIGSASDYALGSLHTTEFIKNVTMKQRVEYALATAAEFSTTCSAPFDIISIGEK